MHRKMKDSGVEWIGQIPEDWQITKVKYILANSINKNQCKINYIGLENIEKETGRYIESNGDTYASGDTLSYEQGQILFGKLRPYLAKVFKTNTEGCCSGELLVLSVLHGSPDYYFYRLLSPDFIDYVNSSTYGTKMPRANWTFIKEINTAFPPLQTQHRIAAYLDEKVAHIDNIIDKTKQTIEEYKKYKQSLITEAVTKGLNPDVKMKDSVIEWIGQIPEHWDVRRGKVVLTLLGRDVIETDETITCFRDGEVTLRKNRREDGFTNSLKEIGYQGIEPGDLVVHGMDGFAGAIGISDSRGKGSPVLNVLDSQENKKYLMYYLRTLAYRNVFMGLSTGIRVRSCDLRWSKLANLAYVVPPKVEQIDISSYLDVIGSKIEKAIVQKQSIVAELESYKKSLIYEVVTGKREVS